MIVPKIYAFETNEEGTELKIIVCCGYNLNIEGDRERAIKEVQKDIQWKDAKSILVIDGVNLPVVPVNTIKI